MTTVYIVSFCANMLLPLQFIQSKPDKESYVVVEKTVEKSAEYNHYL